MSKKKNVLLISPTSTRPGLISKIVRYIPLNLVTVGGLTPKSKYQYTIIDENIERVNFDSRYVREADLVGETVMTAQAPHAYWIADEFRRRGIPVVLGGIHPTALPNEAAAHADSVVIGEAEEVWPKLLEDFGRGQLKKFYKNGEWISLSKLSIPRRDLLKKYRYPFSNTFQVSRGCPFDCSFCSVSNFFGKKYRFRPVEDVIAEIRGTMEENKSEVVDWWRISSRLWKKVSDRTLVFVDDNIFGNPQYARRLFEALAPLKMYWGSQASINIARPRNEDLLRLAAESGCKVLFVGLESVSQSSLDEIGKKVNKPESYEKAIELFHKYGITVVGAFVLGFDSEDKGIFERTLDFAKRIRVDIIQVTVLTPLPGTRLMEKLEREGRIIERDWSRYDFGEAVFQPKKMSREKLEQGANWVRNRFYSLGSMWQRRPPFRDWLRYIIYWVGNVGYKIQVYKMLKYKRKRDLNRSSFI